MVKPVYPPTTLLGGGGGITIEQDGDKYFYSILSLHYHGDMRMKFFRIVPLLKKHLRRFSI
jgi:hypothetical protein